MRIRKYEARTRKHVRSGTWRNAAGSVVEHSPRAKLREGQALGAGTGGTQAGQAKDVLWKGYRVL